MNFRIYHYMLAKVVEDKKWEYKKVYKFEELEDYGAQGWELVCSAIVTEHWQEVQCFILKRSYIEKEI